MLQECFLKSKNGNFNYLSCNEQVRMIQRNFRLWQFAMRSLERKFLNEWRKIERPLVVSMLKKQDEMAKDMNLQINIVLGSVVDNPPWRYIAGPLPGAARHPWSVGLAICSFSLV